MAQVHFIRLPRDLDQILKAHPEIPDMLRGERQREVRVQWVIGEWLKAHGNGSAAKAGAAAPEN